MTLTKIIKAQKNLNPAKHKKIKNFLQTQNRYIDEDRSFIQEPIDREQAKKIIKNKYQKLRDKHLQVLEKNRGVDTNETEADRTLDEKAKKFQLQEFERLRFMTAQKDAQGNSREFSISHVLQNERVSLFLGVHFYQA